MSDRRTDDTMPPVNRSYVDSVDIRIRIVDSAADEAVVVEEWTISASSAAWEPDWLVRHAEAIALSAGPTGTGFPTEYYIEIKERRLNWGADVAVFDILIGIASWAATSVAWDVTKSLALKMQDRLRGDAPEQPEESLTDARATTAAISAIESSYSEDEAALTVRSVQLTANSATVTVWSNSGWLYEYDLELCGGLVEVSRVRRSQSNEP